MADGNEIRQDIDKVTTNCVIQCRHSTNQRIWVENKWLFVDAAEFAPYCLIKCIYNYVPHSGVKIWYNHCPLQGHETAVNITFHISIQISHLVRIRIIHSI